MILMGKFAFSQLHSDSSFFEKRKAFITSLVLKKDSLSFIPKNPYYEDYSQKFALFLYSKIKYNRFSVTNLAQKKTLFYSPNEQMNMGFGFHYKFLGIGIALNFGFINHDNKDYGKTRRLDLQTNIYMKKFVVDFYLQYYKGFYIQNPEDVFSEWNSEQRSYIRPDISSFDVGIGGMYVFNHERFSYKSAFLQTAIQKKSAGSFLLGGQIFFQGVVGDSTFFPQQSFFGDLPKAKGHSATYIGVLTAYAYNFIILKHYFFSVSMMGSIHLGATYTLMESGNEYTNILPVLHLQPRVALGMNRPKWYAGMSFVKDTYVELVDKKDSDWSYTFYSGNLRIFLGYRFDWFSEK